MALLACMCVLLPSASAQPADSLAQARNAVQTGQAPRAIEIYERLVGQGSIEAMVELGELYVRGMQVDKHLPRGCELFERAAARGSLEARVQFGHCFLVDLQGRERDFGRALAQYRIAADKGYPPALCAIGYLHVEGHGLPKDPARGLAMCQDGAARGDPGAQYYLGELYYLGLTSPREPEKALHWFTKAAEQRDFRAIFMVGRMHLFGEGTVRDERVAAGWLRKASMNRDPRAYALLGDIYFGWATKNPHKLDDHDAMVALDLLDHAVRDDPDAEMRVRSEVRRSALLNADPTLRPRLTAARGQATKR